jgi:hypothetical protein
MHGGAGPRACEPVGERYQHAVQEEREDPVAQALVMVLGAQSKREVLRCLRRACPVRLRRGPHRLDRGAPGGGEAR